MSDIIELIIARVRELTAGLTATNEKGEAVAIAIDDSGELPDGSSESGDCPFVIVRETSGDINDPDETINILVMAGLYVPAGGKDGRERIRDLKDILARIPQQSFTGHGFTGSIKYEYGVEGRQEPHHFYVRLRLSFIRESEIFSYTE